MSRIRSAVRGYGLAVLSVACALGLELLLKGRIPGLFWIAIALSVWYAGVGPGILALVLSISALKYFSEPGHNFHIIRDDIPYYVAFILFALLIAWLSNVRRRVERNLLQSRDELQREVTIRTQQARLLDLTRDPIFVRDMNEVITYWNRGAQELYGFTAEQTIGKHSHELLRTVFPVPLDDIIAEVQRSGRWEGDLKNAKADGTEVVVSSHWCLQRDEQGRPVSILESNNDITERKHREEDIRGLNQELARRTATQKAYLDELFEQAPEGVVLLDVQDCILRVNREFTRMFGYTPEEAVGYPINDLIAPAELRGEAHEYTHGILHGKTIRAETIRRRKDGGRVPVSLLAVPVSVPGEQIAEYAIYRDLTRYKAVEGELTLQKAHLEEIRGLNEELAKRSRELEATNRELEAFAYSISHDLRAPLRHISGYTELLHKQFSSEDNEKSNRYITTILESAKRMGNLIDDLLAFSRIGRAETQETLVNLEDLVREALTEVRHEFGERQITWKISGLPSVYGDRSMLRMVLVNLLSNAIKFTRTRPQVEIEIGRADRSKNEAVVFVKDNGVGFDMKYVKRLFGVFQRLHQADAFEGTGIGLATVQRIIHRHGGSVWAEGAVDKGATFYFSIPTPQGYLWKSAAN